MLTYIIPTRNRAPRLGRTLHELASLRPHDAEVVVVDNNSDCCVPLPTRLANGLPVRMVEEVSNIGAAARNDGAVVADPASEWLVMLDDDSYPVDTQHLDVLAEQPADVGAVMADIFLTPTAPPWPDSVATAGAASLLASRSRPQRFTRESGGLPEVFVGCGVAIRRRLFLELGGYDASFGYYAEEYDLAARIIRAGARVVFDARFVVHHAKDRSNRDMNLILSRLVRNNGWVTARYAPDQQRGRELREIRSRYRGIAEREGARSGYLDGLTQLRRTIKAQPRRTMPGPEWDRFTGLAAAREALDRAARVQSIRTALVVDEGKNAWVIHQALAEFGIRVVRDPNAAAALVIGTMSPGPMLDALHRRRTEPSGESDGIRIVAPWIGAAAVDAGAGSVSFAA